MIKEGKLKHIIIRRNCFSSTVYDDEILLYLLENFIKNFKKYLQDNQKQIIMILG